MGPGHTPTLEVELSPLGGDCLFAKREVALTQEGHLSDRSTRVRRHRCSLRRNYLETQVRIRCSVSSHDAVRMTDSDWYW